MLYDVVDGPTYQKVQAHVLNGIRSWYRLNWWNAAGGKHLPVDDLKRTAIAAALAALAEGRDFQAAVGEGLTHAQRLAYDDIARGKLRWTRQGGKVKVQSLTVPPIDDLDSRVDEETPESVLLDNEGHANVEAALAALSDNERAAMRAAVEWGCVKGKRWQSREAAASIDMDYSTFTSAVSSARKKLAEVL